MNQGNPEPSMATPPGESESGNRLSSWKEDARPAFVAAVLVILVLGLLWAIPHPSWLADKGETQASGSGAVGSSSGRSALDNQKIGGADQGSDSGSGETGGHGTPIWELPEVVSKYPVKAPQRPDGTYDYAVDGFVNADICGDLSPQYYEQYGIELLPLRHRTYYTEKTCIFKSSNVPEGYQGGLGTDAIEDVRKGVRVVNEYSPTEFDIQANSKYYIMCISYIETPIGRVGTAMTAKIGEYSIEEACQESRKLLEEFKRGR